MRNIIETYEFKLKCAKYHYNQSLEASRNLTKDNIHIFISEFCAMMIVLESCIEIARSCAYKQSTVDVKHFEKSLKEADEDELHYIEQFLVANRKGNVFKIIDNKEIQIIPIPRKHESGAYEKRNVVNYMRQVMIFAENLINEYMQIYTKSASHFDQSWRTIDMYEAIFLCKECGSSVTHLLRHIGNLSDISLEVKEPFISSRWNYVYGHELIRAALLPWHGVDEVTENEIIVSIEALDYDVKKEPALGCCGPDSSEFNIYCRNGHAVGKEAADCWMPHFIRLPLDKVTRDESI